MTMTQGPYQPNDGEQSLISQLETFRSAVERWARSTTNAEGKAALRSSINQQLAEVRDIVRLAQCLKKMSVHPPAIIGGPVAHVDGFDHLFEPLYGVSMVGPVLDMLDQAIGVIRSGKFEAQRRFVETMSENPHSGRSSTKVFLVHGHDDGARAETARFLEKLGLEPIILHEQASLGKTIIEKIERYSEVAFTVVLLTPDDVGAKKGAEPALRPRARQNVILELGYFMGKLGRQNVAALLKGDLEKPSDYDGVNYIPMDPGGGWMQELFKELRAAGLSVDFNKAICA
jgi:predicted nucleotide-binding protein